MQLEPYHGGRKKVVVYNTYAEGGKLHFDVFIPTDKSTAGQVSKDMDAKAVEYAKEFLELIGKKKSADAAGNDNNNGLMVNMCERCHIDDTSLYSNELWQLPGKDVFIWPMEGCPKPN
ncbi:MAG TPA: DUF2024 family protein [Nitrososphaera sp.]|nr:DUF2024 family protein [Nitrososphaera sp.]